MQDDYFLSNFPHDCAAICRAGLFFSGALFIMEEKKDPLEGDAEGVAAMRYAGFCGRETSVIALGTMDFGGKIEEGKGVDRKSTRLNSSHCRISRMPSSA